MHRKSDKPVRYILVKMPEFYYTPRKSISPGAGGDLVAMKGPQG